ncbi:MAG TPA: acyl-CoA synthetase, partial [Hyphomicrobium sp.]|nr:acyl-CoA synthetase [Hyphomicrobium sp.]
MILSPYSQNLDKNPANYQPLTPLTFLDRAAVVYPNHPAIIHGAQQFTWKEFYGRCRRLASALSRLQIGPGDTVSVMLSNTPPMLEAHYAVPMLGAVLHSLNTRLDAPILAFQLDHADCKVLITDREFAGPMAEALALAKVRPIIIDYNDLEFPQTGRALSHLDYETLLANSDPEFAWRMPEDEWDAISLNYTSGTTGNPKGVVYHHRGAALMCYSNTIATGMGRHPVYLWTLPMFHCNGWCFTWSLAMVAGTHICLRWVRAKAMYDAIADYKVTNISGAPIVMATLLGAKPEEKREIRHRVSFNHAAAPPPQAVLDAMVAAGFDLTHLYGLTETYGPATINEWNTEWLALDEEAKAKKRIRQGVRYVALEDLTVMNPETMIPVPADGETMGEVMFRGNIVMKGYLKNADATAEAFAGGWFHSGDLGVLHPDGYIQLKDRSKDVIISGGENISSIEVEDVLYKHPAVAACAVVAKPDEKWGETPCAFVELKTGATVSKEEIVTWCRER